MKKQYVIKDIESNNYISTIHEKIGDFHFTFDKETRKIFNNKWEANKFLKRLSNKRRFKNFRIEED